MNDIVELKDYLIADEIIRIKSLSTEQLVQELIEIKSVQIEALSDLKAIQNYARQKPN